MIKRALCAVSLGLLLAGCGDKVQVGAAPAKKADAKAWEGASNDYVAPGWKAGDQGSWESQMRTRAQAQNEYNRSAAQR